VIKGVPISAASGQVGFEVVEVLSLFCPSYRQFSVVRSTANGDLHNFGA
jgi:hypothetical protein